LPKPGLATRAALFIAVAAGPASSGVRPFTLPAWTIQRRTRTRITGSKRAGSTGPDNSHRVRPLYIIAKRFTFSASHLIGSLPAQHLCAQLHHRNSEHFVEFHSVSLLSLSLFRAF